MNLLNIFMHSRPIHIVLGTRMVFIVRSHHGLCVWKPLILAYMVYDIHSVAAGTTIEPEVHHIVDGIPDLRIFPVEIRLLWREQREKVFICFGVIGPGTVCFAKDL